MVGCCDFIKIMKSMVQPFEFKAFCPIASGLLARDLEEFYATEQSDGLRI
jgi:hypothetical protein